MSDYIKRNDDMVSIQARKQRKAHANAPLHERRKAIAAHLSKELRGKYKHRAITVRKGDTVKVIRGSFKGHTEKVSDVDTKAYKIYIEGLTLSKSDGKKVARPIDPSNVIVTKLDLSDKYRREKLGEKEVPVEESKSPKVSESKSPKVSESKESDVTPRPQDSKTPDLSNNIEDSKTSKEASK